MNKCFNPNSPTLKCPRVILPIRNLAPNNINMSKAMRRAMKIRNKKSCGSCSTNRISLQKFQNEFNSSISNFSINTNTFTNGNFCPSGLYYSYWINKS